MRFVEIFYSLITVNTLRVGNESIVLDLSPCSEHRSTFLFLFEAEEKHRHRLFTERLFTGRCKLNGWLSKWRNVKLFCLVGVIFFFPSPPDIKRLASTSSLQTCLQLPRRSLFTTRAAERTFFPCKMPRVRDLRCQLVLPERSGNDFCRLFNRYTQLYRIYRRNNSLAYSSGISNET